MGWCARRCAILDLSWGIAGPLGVMLLAEQGADVIKVEPPGGDPFRAYSGYAVWNRSPPLGDDRPEVRRRPRGVRSGSSTTPTCSSRRSGPASPTGSASGTTTVHARNPRLVYLSCPGYPEGPPPRRPPRLRRARPGEQRPAVGAAGLADGPDLPAHADAEHGRVLPDPERDPRRARSRARRPGAASTCTTSLFQGALLYTTQIWQHVEKAPAAFHDLMGKSYPPGIHQQMLFEVRGRRVGALVGDERPHADEEPGRAPRARGPARPDDVPHDAARGAREVHRQAPGGVPQRTTATSSSRSVPGAQPRDRGGHHDGGGARRRAVRRIPQLVANGMVADRRRPRARRAPRRSACRSTCSARRAAIQGPQPMPGEHNREILGALGYSDAELARSREAA